ncbi:MAG TPA: hypothetical protein VIP98_00935, partial [Microlunatus sp.]
MIDLLGEHERRCARVTVHGLQLEDGSIHLLLRFIEQVQGVGQPDRGQGRRVLQAERCSEMEAEVEEAVT